MSKYDILIKGGTIVDGTNMPRFFGDIGIKNGLIERISSNIPASDAARIIDAQGKIVAPGVIDPHTHYDAQIHWDPYCTNSGWHGNTSVVVGNCGFGFMPCAPEARERYMLMMENTEQVPLSAMRAALPWTWETFPQWIDHMKQVHKGVNVAAFMPLNSLMIYVMGYEASKKRGATPAERQRMRDLLNEAMDKGAIGFGFSYLNQFNSHRDIDGSPMPTDMMQIDDALYLGEVLRERDQGVIQMLAELPVVVANRREVEEMARVSGRPVLHTVIAAFDDLPDFHTSVMGWLDDVEAKGLNIFSQALAARTWNEFNAVDYNVWQNVDPFLEFTNCGDAAAKAALAADPAFRKRASEQYDPAQMGGAGGPLESLILHGARGAADWVKYEGKQIDEIARLENGKPIDVFFDIVAASDAMADFRTTVSSSEDPEKIAQILRHKRTLAGTSDGGAHVKFFSGGQYATDNIVHLVRGSGLMSLEEIHHKLSYVPARVLGFHKRGALVEGYAADIYIYDYNGLNYKRNEYEVVHDLPGGEFRRVVRAEGIEWIMVNGEITFKGGQTTGAVPGRLLGNGGPQIDASLLTRSGIAAE
ncbi:MAG TPA: amidohydrolase family protein [Parvibaculum sp.]|jgi:N-acyl-D-aspartate/D-glutamate deacylase